MVAMGTLGDRLREERLRRGLKFEEIAAVIKIPHYMVEAMETGQFDRLPGGAYRRSFLRQYAHLLGVNEEEAVAEFKQEYGDPELPLPAPRHKSRKVPLGAMWAALAAITCVGAYKLMPSIKLDMPVLAGSKQAAPASQAGFAPPVELPPPPTVADKPAAASATAPVHVSLQGNEPIWVSVECDGLNTYRGMVGSEAKEFSATGKIVVLAGDSGGLRVTLNGQLLEPFGSRHQIGTIELTANGARSIPRHRGTAADQPAEPPVKPATRPPEQSAAPPVKPAAPVGKPAAAPDMPVAQPPTPLPTPPPMPPKPPAYSSPMP